MQGAPEAAIPAIQAPELIVAVETAADVSSAVAALLDRLARIGRGERVEWWRPDEEGKAMRLHHAEGVRPCRRRTAVPLGPLGVVTVGETAAAVLVPEVTRLVPLLRRRFDAERLIEVTSSLARRNEALQDFAALVAHELKTPLVTALRMNDAEHGLIAALELVDSLLEAARADDCGEAACAATCLGEALRLLGAIPARVSAELAGAVPISGTALRLVLRNLIANAVAAGASEINVHATATARTWTLTVDDDGVGLDDGSYASGSGLGLSLTRRFVARLGATLELAPRVPRGTRATLAIEGER